MARLGDICSINMGQSPDSSTYNEEHIGLPFFQGNADFGTIHPSVRIWCSAPVKTAKKNDILISVRAPIGALNIADSECCIGRGLAALTVNPSVCAQKYLWYGLESKIRELNSKGTGSTFKAISKSILHETEIPLPSIAEQVQVADTLDKVSNLIALRKRQLDKLDELVKARFIELFGNPMNTETKWQRATIGDRFDVTSGGTPSTGERSYWENGNIPWIGSNMCQDAVLYENDGKFITEEGYDHSSAKWFCSGTVLVALVGATIGKTALLRFNTTTNQNIAAIDVTRNKDFTSEFVFYHLQFQYDKFMEIGSGKFKMANQGFIRQLPLICPPLELQQQFSSFVEQTNKSKLTIRQGLDKLEVLKKSLMQEYFG